MLAGLALTSAPAWAGCTTSGTTATCTGDLSGIAEFSYDSGSVDTLIFQDIDRAYERGGNSSLISLTDVGDDGTDDGDSGSAADDLTITYDTGDYGFDATYGTTTGIQVSSEGGAGTAAGGVLNTSTPAGDGGAGGAGGTATLDATSGWYQQSGGTTGISLTSTGGAGAQGGEASATAKQVIHLYGGDGGAGGASATVTATLDGLGNPAGGAGIQLTGLHTGIEVISTGGDGGDGGELRCDVESYNCYASSGEGGAGGAGGAASLSASGSSISITDFKTTGIALTSTGGAGGKGGLTKLDQEPVWAENDGDYGRGGDGGAGGALTFDLTGSFVTATDSAGKASHAIAVTSFGGAGGDGNDNEGSKGAGDGNLGVNHLYSGFGNGGDGGSGGTVSLQLTGSGITASVSKDDAIAVWIASKGGDGGTIGTVNYSPTSSIWGSNKVDITANGGDGGDGGMLSVDANSGSTLTLSTSGAGGSKGALTMVSAGGDGGDGAGGTYYSFYGADSVGGDGGDGGEIKVTFDGTVTATTSGDDAFGLMFESTGGDGGTGYAGDGDGGAGGAVGVTLGTVAITTTGAGSHGVYASSLGGNGGDSTSGGGDGSNGDGGAVTLEIDAGTIAVSGDTAHGIYAISQPGSGGSAAGGVSGDVKVTLGANLTVSGEDAIGIYLKSSGNSGNGDLSVTIASGGSVTASGDAETAVNFGVGDSNTLVNDGTIATDDLTSSTIFALTSKEGGVGVTNNGTFSGSVKLADGFSSSFMNSTSGTLNLGSYFYLGTDGTLTNEGIVSPGGKGSVLSSSVTGAFTQSSDGTYLVDIDGSSTDALTFETAGTTIAGTVQVNVVTSPSSSGSATIALAKSGSIDASGLSVSDTATTDYTLDTSNSSAVNLDWDVSLDDAAALGSANGNQSSVANHLQQILENGGLGPELSQLLNIVSVEDYLAALDTLASQVSSDGQLTALMSNMQFSDALLSCADYAGAYRFVSQDQCAWLKFGVIRSERDGSSENHPFDQTAAQFAGGAQFQIAEDWHVGGGFSVENQWLTVDDIAESQGTFYQGGLVTKRSFGNTIVSASLSGGYGSFDITRALAMLGTATGTEPLWTVSGQLSASHAFTGGGPWYIKPRVDLAFDHVVMEGYTEHGAGGASLTFEAECRDLCQRAAGRRDRRGAERRQRPADPAEPECRPHALPDRCGAVRAGVFRRHPGGRGAVHHRERLRQDLCRREGRGGGPLRRGFHRPAAGLRPVLGEHHQLRRIGKNRHQILGDEDPVGGSLVSRSRPRLRFQGALSDVWPPDGRPGQHLAAAIRFEARFGRTLHFRRSLSGARTVESAAKPPH